MKAKFLFVIVILLSCIINVNAQVIISESFENAFPPTGWTTLTGANTNPFQLSTTDPAINGTRCMKQQSDNQYGSDAWIFSAGYPLTAGVNYRISYWYRTLQGGSLMHYKVTLGRTPTVSGQLSTVLGNFINVSTTVYTQSNLVFTVPETNVYYFAFNSYNYSMYANGRLLIDSVVLEQTSGTTCTGTPAGTITGPSQICPDSTFVLSATGISGAGVGYQWQSSPAGANNFTNITDATSNTYTTTQTTSKDYRFLATCHFSGQSAISSIQSVTSPAFCYCTPSQNTCVTSYIANVTFAGINNTTTCGANGFTDYSLTLPPANITANTSEPLSVTVGSGNTKYVSAWIDYDHNGIFDASEYIQVGTGNGTTISTSVNISATALGGLTRIRFRLKTNSYATNPCLAYPLNGGEAEDYAVNITPYSCSGTPAAGTVTGISNICPGTSFTLTLSGTYPGLDLQWESSPLGANTFSAIAGANSTSLITSQTASTDYRVKVTCVASGLFAYSNIKSVTSPPFCYCPPSNSCTTTYISNVSFGSINNSSGCSASGDYTASVSPATITAGTTTPLSVTLTAGNSGQVAAWIDLNRNGTFETTEYTVIGSGAGGVVSGSIFIPSGILPGTTRLRVKWNSGGTLSGTSACFTLNNGETEDYSINILAAPIAIYFTPFADSLYDPAINVTARIVQRDVGLNVTDSLKPRLWAKKQSGIWKSFKGQLQSGTTNDGYWVFPVNNDSLGTRRNGCDSIQFYFVAQDLNTPSNLGYLPEIGALHTNVQVQVTPPNQLFGYRLKPRLKDTVYVSVSDCRYQSLSKENGLFQQINLRKLEGNLTILIESDLLENAVHELTGTGLNGYSLTIRPVDNTLRTLYQNVNYSSLIKLSGVKNVVIDGSHNGSGKFLAFTNGSSSSQFFDSLSCIEIKNTCDSITLKNIIFRHTVWLISPTTAGEHAVFIRNGANKNIFILNNLFTDIPSANMCARHIGINAGNNDIIIRGNEFNNFTRAGIIAFGAGNNWVIDSNHFYRTTVPPFTTNDFNGILTMGGGHTITNNYVGGQAPFCAGNAMTLIDNANGFINCIQATGPTGTGTVVLSNNRVDNIDMSLTFTARARAFAGITASDNDFIITNNIVGNPQSSTATITPLAEAILGLGAGGTGTAEIRDNIVTSLSNKAGAGPDYDHIALTGLSRGGALGIVSGNAVYNIHNYNNAHHSSDLEMPFTTGIAISGGNDKLIEKNIIHDISCNEYAISGIVFVSADGPGLTTIQQNRIYNLVNTNNFNGHITGIRMSNVRNSVDILNNQIAITNNNLVKPINIWGIQEVSGIGIYPNAIKRVIYNSLYIGGVATGTATSYGYNHTAINSTIESRTIFNNIFYNERTGGSVGHFAYKFLSNTQSQVLNNTIADHNFYALHDSLKFTQWGNSTVLGWPTWRSNNNFEDSSSVSTPALTAASQLFVDKVQGNLNIIDTNSICWRVNQKGKPFPGIDKDYGAAGVRSTDVVNGKTDIGSDEFNTITPPPIPGLVSLCEADNTSMISNVSGAVYQWQVDTGTGFTNISDNANYSGSNSSTLQLSNLPTAWYGYQYRCLVDGIYSSVQRLVFANTWLGTVSTAWEDPANWSCGTLPDGNTDVYIYSGNVLVSSNGICRSIGLASGVNFTIATGATLTVTH